MALIVINSTLTAPGSVIDLGTSNDLSVGRDGYAASTGGSAAITGSGSAHWVRVEGTLTGGTGLSLGDNVLVDKNQRVLIAATGVVAGDLYGIYLGAFDNVVTNLGLIDGFFGVLFAGIGTEMSLFQNDGVVMGGNFGVIASNGEGLRVVNTGTIMAERSVSGGSQNDILRNRGDLFGDVDLGGGQDLYDGRGGAVEGWVSMGSGADTIRAGLGGEFIDGGADIDTLDFQYGGAVKVALDGSIVATRGAADDVYVNIEEVIGSRQGADVIVGDELANRLEGLGGNDTLSGGLGQDTLVGGRGVDRLNLGAGNDRIVFGTAAEAGDTVVDFRNLAGDDDGFLISALGFGGGLVAGVLAAGQFQTRADNLAQDADDRFIFVTVDRTLWFDVNGNAAGGLSLLADLQASATVTALDILVI